MTFSIVAYDAEENALGVAVASKFLAAGAIVSWAKGGVGAIATQSFAKVSFGPDGLALMEAGKTAQETLRALLADDPGKAQRQVGIVDTKGNVAAHTGEKCMDWAGHVTGENFTCQGNILVSEETVDAMADAFRHANGELADRLLAALMAGDTAGGDRRGRQSAAMLVVRPNGGYGGDNDRYLDLRIDDDPNPMKKLKELVAVHHLFFGTPKAEDQLGINTEIAAELQNMMIKQGYFGGEANGEWDEMSKQAFWALVGNENLEERWSINRETDVIDRVALDYLRGRFRK